MRIRALKAKRAELVAEADAMFKLAEKENRSLTAAEVERDNAIAAELEANKAETIRLEAHAERIRNEPSSDVMPAPGAPVVHPDESRVTVGAANVEKDPKRGFRDHKELLACVMVAGRSGRVDERLKLLATQGSDEQGVYSDPAGGFLVPTAIAPGILSIQPEDDPIAGLATQVTMSAPTVNFNARVDKNHSTSVSGGLTVSRRSETVDGTSSRMIFEQVTLTANEEFGMAFASERILSDSPESFVSILAAGFRDEYAAFAQNERINGAGTGERMGFLNSPAKITVAKQSGQTAATILKENIDKMEARCWRYGRAVWLANHNTRPQLKSIVQAVGTGGAPVGYFVGDTLDGRPIFFTEFAKTLGTEGDLILVVPSEYMEAMYESPQYAESIHVRFAAAERAFRFYRRTDGRPWWTSPLTPKNGDTLSPIVTLAVRA